MYLACPHLLPGFIVNEAKALNIAAPVNASLTYGVRALTQARLAAAATTASTLTEANGSSESEEEGDGILPRALPMGQMLDGEALDRLAAATQPSAAGAAAAAPMTPQRQQAQVGQATASATTPVDSLPVLKTVTDMRSFVRSLRGTDGSSNGDSGAATASPGVVNGARARSHATIGFVPTMGSLHAGHLELVKQSLRECDRTVVSIFVNPLQFAAHEDLDTYPVSVQEDLRQLGELGVHGVFVPTRRVMYPHGEPNARIVIDNATQLAEGGSRPHFFDGVATVVAKLFNIVQPDKAFFGQKDAQQCATIRSLITDLDFDVDLRIGPTVREADGLAMSSRNLRLSPEARLKAPVLFQALRAAEREYSAGERRPLQLQRVCLGVLQREPDLSIHYVDVADAATMQPLGELSALDNQQLCVSVAATLAGVRLIDNILLPPPSA